MKIVTFLTLMMALLLVSCEKEEMPVVTVNQLYGKWEGNLKYRIDGNDVNISHTKTISNKNNELLIVWWVVPKCETTTRLIDNRYAINSLLIDSTKCYGNAYTWTLEWKGTGTLVGDTLHESGILEYRRYCNDTIEISEDTKWICNSVKIS